MKSQPQIFPRCQSEEMTTRHHGKASVPKVSSGNTKGLASQILTQGEQISPKPTTSDSLKQAKQVPIKEEKICFLFPDRQQQFLPFSLSIFMSSTKTDKHIAFYKAMSVKSMNFESSYLIIK